jgi:DNA-binding response OmpR family regulator
MHPKILLIEHDNMFRWQLLHFFGERNYQILEAENSTIGLKLARTHQPDLILCEVDLPRFNGYDVLKQLQKDLKTATIPFVFLANRDESERLSALKAGATDFLSKALPFNEVFERLLPHLKLSLPADSSIKTTEVSESCR